MNLNHGGNILTASKLMNCKPEEILDFSNNLNPLGIPKDLKNILKKSIDNINYLPEIDCFETRKIIADYYKVKTSNILLANGSSVFINMLNKIIPKNSKILITVPNYSDYPYLFQTFKNKSLFEFIDKNKIDTFIKEIKKYNVVVLSNPNNPIGYYINNLKQIIKKNQNKLFIIDESYIDFVPDGKSLITNLKNIIVIKSITKFLHAPGLRIGFVYTNNNLIKKMADLLYPWPVNSLTHKTIQFYFENFNNLQAKTLDFIKKEKNIFIKNLDKDFEYTKSDLHFFVLKIKKKNIDSNIIYEHLLKNKILVRNCKKIIGLNKNYIRIAIKHRKYNKILLKKLSEIK